MIKISPSILASDFSVLGTEVMQMQKAGADMLHLDIMDGHFVPNLSFGAPIIASLRKKSNMFFDTHLMISHPLEYAQSFASAGSNRITFHIESEDNTGDVIAKILSLNVEAGISLKPATGIDKVVPYLKNLSQVLIMTVEPGFGGQSFMEDMLDKILELRKYKEANNLSFDIQVDGGIDCTTAPLVCSHGANVLVAGTSLFGASDYHTAVSQLRQAGINGMNNKLF